MIQLKNKKITVQMKNKINNLKETIDSKEILLRTMLLILTIVLVYYSDSTSRQVINIFGFLIAFFVSIKLHRHFFPLMTATLFMYLVASLQEFMNITYVYSVVTDTYWKLGNGLLIVSILRFTYTLIYKYKIVKNDD